MMIRLLAAGPFVKSRLNDKNYCKRHCDAVLAAVIDEAFFNNLLEKSTQILRVALDSLVLNPRDHTQSAELTEKILLLCTQEYYSDKAEPKLGLIPAAEVDFDGYYVGSVKVIVKNRFGFISYGAREFYFKLGGVEVARGERVRFKIRTFREKSEAYDVHTL
jgi:hypothetical protein